MTPPLESFPKIHPNLGTEASFRTIIRFVLNVILMLLDVCFFASSLTFLFLVLVSFTTLQVSLTQGCRPDQSKDALVTETL